MTKEEKILKLTEKTFKDLLKEYYIADDDDFYCLDKIYGKYWASDVNGELYLFSTEKLILNVFADFLNQLILFEYQPLEKKQVESIFWSLIKKHIDYNVEAKNELINCYKFICKNRNEDYNNLFNTCIELSNNDENNCLDLIALRLDLTDDAIYTTYIEAIETTNVLVYGWKPEKYFIEIVKILNERG